MGALNCQTSNKTDCELKIESNLSTINESITKKTHIYKTLYNRVEIAKNELITSMSKNLVHDKNYDSYYGMISKNILSSKAYIEHNKDKSNHKKSYLHSPNGTRTSISKQISSKKSAYVKAYNDIKKITVRTNTVGRPLKKSSGIKSKPITENIAIKKSENEK